MATKTSRRNVRFILFPVMLIGALALSACGAPSGSDAASSSEAAEPSSSGEASTEASTAPSADATPGTDLTACELVAPADIEAVLGMDAGTVAEGTLKQSGTVLDPAVNECRYENQEWGGLIVNVTPTDGVNVFDALTKTYGDSAEELSIGDGAYWFEDNDRGYFLQGSVMAFLQFTFIADGTPFREPTITLGEGLVAKI
jgi:hypothetical protein